MITLSKLSLCVSRLALSAWIGAAVLFVVVGVAEVTSPEFTSTVKDQLAVLRFPLFYAAGFSLVGLSLGLTGLLPWPAGYGTLRRWSVPILLLIALLGMVADYQWVYLPLERLVTPPGQVRTQEFETLHKRSSQVNTINLAFCLVAASLLNWPGSMSDRHSSIVSHT